MFVNCWFIFPLSTVHWACLFLAHNELWKSCYYYTVEGTAQPCEKESTDKGKRELVQNEKGAEVQAGNRLLEEEVQEKSSWLSGWGMSSLTSMVRTFLDFSTLHLRSEYKTFQCFVSAAVARYLEYVNHFWYLLITYVLEYSWGYLVNYANWGQSPGIEVFSF